VRFYFYIPYATPLKVGSLGIASNLGFIIERRPARTPFRNRALSAPQVRKPKTYYWMVWKYACMVQVANIPV
jgi:hypothetical protein